jgi:hypothetical protein
MPQRESREPLGPALVRELDPSLPNLAASFTQRIRHRLDHPEGLLSVRVIHEKDPWRLLGSMDASSVICRSFLVATDACGPRWSTLTLPPGRNAGINRMG